MSDRIFLSASSGAAASTTARSTAHCTGTLPPLGLVHVRVTPRRALGFLRPPVKQAFAFLRSLAPLTFLPPTRAAGRGRRPTFCCRPMRRSRARIEKKEGRKEGRVGHADAMSSHTYERRIILSQSPISGARAASTEWGKSAVWIRNGQNIRSSLSITICQRILASRPRVRLDQMSGAKLSIPERISTSGGQKNRKASCIQKMEGRGRGKLDAAQKINLVKLDP